MDKIVNGVVDGMVVSARHRRFMLLFNFWGFINMSIIIASISAVGYREVARSVQDPGLQVLSQFCAVGSAFGAGSILIAAGALSVHMTRMIRQAEAD